MRFTKPVNARQNIAEWLMGVDLSTSSRLRDDVKEIKSNPLFEKAKTSNWLKRMLFPGLSSDSNASSSPCEQARLTCIYAQFWEKIGSIISTFEHGIGDHDQDSLLRKLQLELLNQITAVTRLYDDSQGNLVSLTSTLANVLVTLTIQRDLVSLFQSSMRDAVSSSSFMLQSQLRKVWDESFGLRLLLGTECLNYGFVYQGFSSSASNKAVFITPLTQRCFYTMSRVLLCAQTTANKSLLILNGNTKSGKSSTLCALAAEAGCDLVTWDCSSGEEHPGMLQRVVQSAVGCFQWLSLHGIEGLRNEALQEVWESLRQATDALDAYGAAAVNGKLKKDDPVLAQFGIPRKVSKSVPVPREVISSTITAQEYIIENALDFSECTFVAMPYRPAHGCLLSLMTTRSSFVESTLPEELCRRLHVIEVHRPLRKVTLECVLLKYNVPQPHAAAVARRLLGLVEHLVADGHLPQRFAWSVLMKAAARASSESAISSSLINLTEKNGERLPPLVIKLNKAKAEAHLSMNIGKIILRECLFAAISHCGDAVSFGAFDSCNDSTKKSGPNLLISMIQPQWDLQRHILLIYNTIELFLSPEDVGENAVDGVDIKVETELNLNEILECFPPALLAVVPQLMSSVRAQLPSGGRRASHTGRNSDRGAEAAVDASKSVAESLLPPATHSLLLDWLKRGDQPCILLGPPGVGKSFILRTVAQQAQFTRTELNPDMQSVWSSDCKLDLIKNATIAAAKEKGSHLVHIDLNCSSELDDVISCSSDVPVVFELCDTKYASPAAISSSFVLLIPNAMHTEHDLLRASIEDIYGSYNNKVVLSRLIWNCVELYILPSYQHCVKRGIDIVGHLSFLLPSQCLIVMHNMLQAFNILASFSLSEHERSVRRAAIYACIWTFGSRPLKLDVGPAAETPRISYDTWFKYHFFDDLNPTDDGADNIKKTIHDSEPSCVGTDDISSVFPVIPEGLTVFELRIYPEERPQGVGIHIKWQLPSSWFESDSRSPGVVPSSRLALCQSQETGFDHIFYASSSPRCSPFPSSLCVPTSTSIALSFIQACALRANTNSQSRMPAFMIAGEIGSGKSTILSQLLYEQESPTNDAMFSIGRDAAHNTCMGFSPPHSLRRRWVAVLGGTSSAADLRTAVQKSHITASSILADAGTSLGAIVVEDLSMVKPTINANESRIGCLLRWLATSVNTFSERSEKPPFLLLSQKSQHDDLSQAHSPFNARLAACCFVVSMNGTDHQSIHASLLAHQCPTLRFDVLGDIVNLSHIVLRGVLSLLRGVKQVSVDNLMAETNLEVESEEQILVNTARDNIFYSRAVTSLCKEITEDLAEALRSLPHFTTNDVLRTWDRVVSCDMLAHFGEYEQIQLEKTIEFVTTQQDLFVGRDFCNLLRRERRTRYEKESQRIEGDVAATAKQVYSPENTIIRRREASNRWASTPTFSSDKGWPGISAWDDARLSLMPRIPSFRANVLRIRAFLTRHVITFGALPALLVLGRPWEENLSSIIVKVATIGTDIGYSFHALFNASDIDRVKTIMDDANSESVYSQLTLFHLHIAAEFTGSGTLTNSLIRLLQLSSNLLSTRVAVTFAKCAVAVAFVNDMKLFSPCAFSSFRLFCVASTILPQSDILSICTFAASADEHLVPQIKETRVSVPVILSRTSKEECNQSRSEFVEEVMSIYANSNLMKSIAVQVAVLLAELPTSVKEASDVQLKIIRGLLSPPTKTSTDQVKPNHRRQAIGADNHNFSLNPLTVNFREESMSFNFMLLIATSRLKSLCSAKGVQSYLLNLLDHILDLEAKDAVYSSIVVLQINERRQALIRHINNFALAQVENTFAASYFKDSFAPHRNYAEIMDPAILSFKTVALNLQKRKNVISNWFGKLYSFSASETRCGSMVLSAPIIPQVIPSFSLRLECVRFVSSFIYALQVDNCKDNQIYWSILSDNILSFREGEVLMNISIGEHNIRLHHSQTDLARVHTYSAELVHQVNTITTLGLSQTMYCSWTLPLVL